MSDAAANKAILQDAYRPWHETRGGAVDEPFAIYADGVRFGSLTQGAAPAAFTALRNGKAQMRGYFAELLANWSMHYHTIHDMIAEDDRIAVACSTAWTNKTVETPKVDIWRFKDGRAVEFYEYYGTAKLFAAATPG